MIEQVFPYVGWNYLNNIGDKIAANVVEFASSARPVFSQREENHVLPIGSTLFLANKNSHLWGVGSLTEYMPNVDIITRNVHAIRGKNTADLLTRSGYRVGDIPFGDPGIFISDITSCSSGQQLGKIVIIPHYSKYVFYKGFFGNCDDIIVIDTSTSSLDLINSILEADTVISESLHGLIFSSSFSKKLIWIGDDQTNQFKYKDWLSTTDSPELPMYKLNNFSDIDILIKHSSTVRCLANKKDLLNSFPKFLSYFRTKKAEVSYKEARSHRYIMQFMDKTQFEVYPHGNYAPGKMYDTSIKIHSNIMKYWDEPVYGFFILSNGGPVPTKEQIDEIIFEMDHHTHDYAIFISKDYAIDNAIEFYPCGIHTFYSTQSVEFCCSILVRPFYEVKPRDFVVFVI